MAIDKDLDNPKNHTISAKLSEKVGHSLPVLFLSEILRNYGDGLKFIDARQAQNFMSSAFITGALGLTAANHLGAFDHEVTIFPEVDGAYSFQSALDENGYLAVSSDNGATGYALFREGENYRLYSFDSRHRNEGHLVLTLENDKDDAWYTARTLSQDFTSLEIAALDVNAPFDAPQWEVYSFENVTEFVEADNGSVRRFAGALVSQDEVYPTIAMQYDVLGEAWQDASMAMMNGRTGMDESYIDAHEGAFSTEITNNFDEDEASTIQFYGFLLGSLILGATSTAGTFRRRKEFVNSKKKLKP
jgi:hypothetical protein